MDILIIQNNRVAITPQAMAIYPFSHIWEQNEEGIAVQKLSFIEFMCSYKKSNPFIGYQEYNENDPTKNRNINICNSFSPSGEGEPILTMMNEDDLVMAAIKIYREIQEKESVSLAFYEASVIGAHKMIDFFTTFDLSETSERGQLLYKPADITRALKDTNEILRTLSNLKEKVAQEIFESTKGKAGREINRFEKTTAERTGQ